jgi:uncharacterized protein (TIGR03790 family)
MRTLLTIVLFLALAGGAQAAEKGAEVIVVYNPAMPGSKDVAEHYAAVRHVPSDQIFGFALSTNEDMSRTEFHDKLEKPLAKAIEAKKLWRMGPQKIPTTNGQPGKVVRKVLESKIRYAVLCYGIPTRIEEDSSVKEEADSLRPELRRNEAAVDSDLAMLPGIDQNLLLAGPLENLTYTTTNATVLDPTNGLLMVARLDGPTAEIARSLVDKAIEGETNGLAGRAYFDLRAVPTNSPMVLGDNWILAAAKICQYFSGYETTMDTNPGTFPPDFPMSQIAIYCGWYSEHVCGPFAQKRVEFMPGAFAYHLHSFSAARVRSPDTHWVGPLLAKGAACTMGCVYEPYLTGTPDVGVFCARWMLLGFTFGESAYACQQTLSWQTTVIGDPLYCPFRKPVPRLLIEQDKNGSQYREWSYLRLANISMNEGKSPMEVINFLDALPETKKSAVLTEKLADLYSSQGMPSSAIENYQLALKLSPSPLQNVRIRLEVAQKMGVAGRMKEAYEVFKGLIAEVPDYPGREDVQKKIESIANQLGEKATTAPH